MIDLVESTAGADGDTAATAYPRLLRIFTVSLVIAVLCGFAAVAMQGSNGLHPAPFLALAALCVMTAVSSFVAMLACVLEESVRSLRRR